MTNFGKFIGLLILVFIVIIGFIFFGKEDEQIADEPIKIGVLAPATGVVADYGEEIKRGILATNTEGVELIFEDTQCDAKQGLNAYRKLIEVDKVQFIIGPGCGAPQEIIAPLVAEDDVLVMVPSAATRSLHEISGGKMFFTQYALEDESQFIADKIDDFGYEKVILIAFQNAFSETHVRSFKEHFKGEIVAELSFLNETSDVASELVKIKNVEADAIFVTDISFLFAQGAARLNQYGIDLPIFSQYATELPAVRDLVPDGMIYSFPENTGQEGAVFELSKMSADTLIGAIAICEADLQCIEEHFKSSGEYNEFGVRNQSIILKQIKNGESMMFNVHNEN